MKSQQRRIKLQQRRTKPEQRRTKLQQRRIKLRQRLWTLAWPLILTNITVPLLGLVDTAVLGHLDSPRYLGAVAIGANLFTFIFWAFGFLRMGTTGLTAQAWGEGDEIKVFEELLRALVVAVSIGLLLWMGQFWLLPTGLGLMQTPADLWSEAETYSNIRILSAPAVLVQYCVIGWLIGCQRSRAVMFIAITTNLVNIALDLLLVLGFGLHAEGVAWATVAAECYAALAGVVTVFRGRWQRAVNICGQQRFWSQREFLGLLGFNRDLFIRTVLLLFVFAFFTAQGAQLGTEILAANAVLLIFLMLTSNALDGFAQGAEALCGEAVGQKDMAAFREAVWVSGCWSVITAFFIAFCFAAGGSLLIGYLTNIEEIRQTAREYLPWLVALPLVGVWSYLFDGIFIGATKVKAMRDTIILATFALYLPCWWLTEGLENHGLWFSVLVFLASRGLIQAALYAYFSYKNHWLNS